MPLVDRLIVVTGTVQGVGFRPFVARLAANLQVDGWVRNDGHGVEILARANASTLDEFTARLFSEAPPAARVAAVTSSPAKAGDRTAAAPDRGFLIIASSAAQALPTATVAPELALCEDCRRELADPADRRYAYPFINCTNCGPRYSILLQLPYDRPHTTMGAFLMCPACQHEYDDPADRRYHAQPNACPACGPQVELRNATGDALASLDAAISMAADALRAGQIVAVKGLGGFHLMADATSETSVAELRRRKHREEKPFAVMFPSLESVRAAAEVDEDDERLLTSAAAPIVLLRRRENTSARPASETLPLLPALAASIAPGNPWTGAMLPYTPLHVLLLEKTGRPVVATSGNLSEEPLCTDNDEARQRLAGIADVFLVHDRPIARPVDDSVVRRSAGAQIILRRARGFAPSPFPLPSGTDAPEPLLCVGGHLKDTVAVTVGTNVVLSPHIGDLSNPISLDAFRRTIALLGSLYGGRTSRVVCDAHPDYASTRFAHSLGLPVTTVQHHLAHVLACLLEHDGGPGRVLGVAWDGTGYGSDGTVWGGEFIVVDRNARTAQRVASLLPFRLPGGEAAVREPRRSALGLLHEAGALDPIHLAPLAMSLGFNDSEMAVLFAMLEGGIQAPLTTSAGRLFDGVAALLGLRLRSSFEGQAAMELEFAADSAPKEEAGLAMPLIAADGREFWQIDWRPAVAEILATRTHGDPRRLAARFHAGLALSIRDVAARVGIETVALSGGCFQNARLHAGARRTLQAAGFTVLSHLGLPPNDGGVAAGQALGAIWGITSVSL
jgi:hydrogenase maturation protein HypF